MTFEDFYKSLREGKSLTNDKGLTHDAYYMIDHENEYSEDKILR